MVCIMLVRRLPLVDVYPIRVCAATEEFSRFIRDSRKRWTHRAHITGDILGGLNRRYPAVAYPPLQDEELARTSTLPKSFHSFFVEGRARLVAGGGKHASKTHTHTHTHACFRRSPRLLLHRTSLQKSLILSTAIASASRALVSRYSASSSIRRRSPPPSALETISGTRISNCDSTRA